MTGGYAEMSGRALRLVREEPDQVLRLRSFRAASLNSGLPRWGCPGTGHSGMVGQAKVAPPE